MKNEKRDVSKVYEVEASKALKSPSFEFDFRGERQ